MRKFIVLVGVLLINITSCIAQEITFIDGTKKDISKALESSHRIRTIMDDVDDGYEIYYLIKDRKDQDKRIEREQVYFYDVGSPDFENEGYIRFINKETKLVGLLNEYGEITIPAIYSDLSRVSNGMIYGLLGAKRKFLGNNKEHWTWTGGKTLLLNTKNEILIDSISEPNVILDMYSVKITDKPFDDGRYDCFKGKNGKYYSFLNLQKSFEYFINKQFIPSTKGNKWKKYLSEHLEVAIEIKDKEIGRYNRITKDEFLNSYQDIISSLFEIARENNADKCELQIHEDTWSGYVDDGQIDSMEFNIYFNDSNVWRMQLFPVFELIIKEKKDKKSRSNHFNFYRDKEGKMVLYRITIRSNYF